MKQIGIVVLNYKNYKETIQCVNSILTQKDIEIHIAIVDNGSNNGSFKKLTDEFSNAKGISVIKNEDNLGYAKGNNVGIDYLRKNGLDFIVVCNSDVTFSNERIIYTMSESDDNSIGVMIPIIKNLDGTIEMRAQYRSKFFPLRMLKELKRMQCISENTVSSKKRIPVKMELLNPGIQKDYFVITGSVFALTPSFFKHYNGLFPETFLYVEELATMMLVYRAKLKCAIVQTDDVIHKGAASTGNDLKAGSLEKQRMIARSAKQVEKLIFLPTFYIKHKYGVKENKNVI